MRANPAAKQAGIDAGGQSTASNFQELPTMLAILTPTPAAASIADRARFAHIPLAHISVTVPARHASGSWAAHESGGEGGEVIVDDLFARP